MFKYCLIMRSLHIYKCGKRILQTNLILSLKNTIIININHIFEGVKLSNPTQLKEWPDFFYYITLSRKTTECISLDFERNANNYCLDGVQLFILHFSVSRVYFITFCPLKFADFAISKHNKSFVVTI